MEQLPRCRNHGDRLTARYAHHVTRKQDASYN